MGASELDDAIARQLEAARAAKSTGSHGAGGGTGSGVSSGRRTTGSPASKVTRVQPLFDDTAHGYKAERVSKGAESDGDTVRLKWPGGSTQMSWPIYSDKVSEHGGNIGLYLESLAGVSKPKAAKATKATKKTGGRKTPAGKPPATKTARKSTKKAASKEATKKTTKRTRKSTTRSSATPTPRKETAMAVMKVTDLERMLKGSTVSTDADDQANEIRKTWKTKDDAGKAKFKAMIEAHDELKKLIGHPYLVEIFGPNAAASTATWNATTGGPTTPAGLPTSGIVGSGETYRVFTTTGSMLAVHQKVGDDWQPSGQTISSLDDYKAVLRKVKPEKGKTLTEPQKVDEAVRICLGISSPKRRFALGNLRAS